jgi:hypothetical protein
VSAFLVRRRSTIVAFDPAYARFACLLRYKPQMPRTAVPRNTIAAGSGTGAGVRTWDVVTLKSEFAPAEITSCWTRENGEWSAVIVPEVSYSNLPGLIPPPFRR